MISIFVNSEHPPIWFVPDIPVGQNGLRAPEYITLLRNFTLKLEERGILPSDIVLQQVFSLVQIFHRLR